MNKRHLTVLAATVLATGVSLIPSIAHSAQVATDPGDYSPLPAGIDLGILYVQHTEHQDYYASGKEISSLAGINELKTDIGLLRWVHYIEAGGYILDPQIILPFGKVSLDTTAGTTSSSGVGDPIVGGTIWVYNNTETKQAFGLTALASLPLGDYDGAKGPVNIGENRWKMITQAGYVTPLTETLSLDLIAEYTFFGENDDFGGARKDQQDQYGIQAHISKSFGPATKATLSYYHDFGGETSLNGVDQDDELNNSSWNATLSHFVAPDLQVMVEYGRSLEVENGFFEEDRLNLRFVKVF
ncbi:transporter [Amphritea atlantica]|uniref:Transporter n=1 Tax=Amphritea atlantica TaxID=355243 RepID=A0ABY5GQN6_9GAMM|nr:transporter [Amphritea atlantica]